MAPLISVNPRPGPTTDDYGDGPYFDLEFFIDSDQENELTSSSSCYSRLSCDDGSYCLLPTDHLIFKRSSLEYSNNNNNNCKQPPSLSKPAAKLRVLMLRLSPSRPRQQKKVDPEEVRIFSLLSRHDGGSVRSDTVSSSPPAAAAKDVFHKYLSKIKPLYFRVSKRYGHLTLGGNKECRQPSSSPVSSNIRKMLRKSRSASAAIAPAVPSPPLPVIEEDGIQSAIAHCKKSLDSHKGLDPVLFRSMSDPGGERSGEAN